MTVTMTDARPSPAHRIEQFKRDCLEGTWRARGQVRPAKRVRPATVNRELATLKAILNWAAKEGKILTSPADHVALLRVENRRLRALTAAEQVARVGQFLALLWADVAPTEIRFLNTKNGRTRRVEITPRMRALLDSLPSRHAPCSSTSARVSHIRTSEKCLSGR